jgi:hypothetical protein
LDERPDPGIAPPLHAMLNGYRAAASATAELAAAELRLAVSTLTLLVELGVAVGVLVTSAWLLVMLAIAAVIADGYSWPVALSALAAVNLLLAAMCRIWMRAIAHHMDFRELRSLLGDGGGSKTPSGSGSGT